MNLHPKLDRQGHANVGALLGGAIGFIFFGLFTGLILGLALYIAFGRLYHERP